MGMDLRLLPFDWDQGESLSYSHTILSCDRDYDLFDQVEKFEPIYRKVPKSFSCFLSRVPDGTYEGERCYGEVNTTSYGDPLKFILVSDLVKIDASKYSERNQAIWAYLKALNPETKVALYWH